MYKVLQIESNENFYPVLIFDEKNLILVDTGFPLTSELIIYEIEKSGFSAEKLTGIIFTHQDIDHIGCIKEFKNLSPNAVLMASEIEASYIEGAKTPVKLARMAEIFDSLNPQMQNFYPIFKKSF